MRPIIGLKLNDLEEILKENGFQKFRAKQIFNWIYNNKINDFNEIKNLPKKLIKFLEENFEINSLKLIEKSGSSDSSKKFLFELKDGNYIETVLMLHDNRKTICISSQVGCPLGCMFCATGKMGFTRNLELYEIVSQLFLIEKIENIKVNNIVFMGMGEPLLNFENIKKAILIFNNELYGFNIGARHITISTAGIPEKIKEIGSLNLQVKLAVSLNSPDQKQRELLMPVTKKYDIKTLINAVKKYQKLTKRRVTFEYIMMKDTNDTMQHALEVAALVSKINCIVNLIPYNRVYGAAFKPSSFEQIEKFKDRLEKYGITVSIRNSLGKGIDAACGQLSTIRLKKDERK